MAAGTADAVRSPGADADTQRRTPILRSGFVASGARQLDSCLRAILREGESANTRRSYGSALRYGRPLTLPVPVPVVLQFVVDHVLRAAAGGLASDLPPAIDAALVEGGDKGALGAPVLATVAHRLPVLAKAHDLTELRNPVRDPAVQEFLRRARRAYASRGAWRSGRQRRLELEDCSPGRRVALKIFASS